MPEIHGLAESGAQAPGPGAKTVAWDDPRLKAITRIRFIGDRWSGPFDLSYCWGTDADGAVVRVQMPVYQVMGKGSTIKSTLVGAAKRDGVFLQRLCGGDISAVLSVSW